MGEVVGQRTNKPVRVVYPIPATQTAASPGLARLGTALGRRSGALVRVEYPPERWSWTKPVLLWLGGLVICLAWDRAAWLWVSVDGLPRWSMIKEFGSFKGAWAALSGRPPFDSAGAGVLALGWVYALAYLAGTLIPWIAVAAVVVFRSWKSTVAGAALAAMWRALLIVGAPTVAGGVAELLRIVVRRVRPDSSDGWLVFRSFGQGPWEGSGLGMPSSHAAVAVAAAAVIGALYPRWRLPVWALAAACVAGRVAVGAHFVSDVYVGATIGAMIGSLARRLLGVRTGVEGRALRLA